MLPLYDIEQEQAPLPCIWSESRTKLLISTYVDHEEEMESRKTKKKDVCRKIAAAMNKTACHVTSTNVENKWNNLLNRTKRLQQTKRARGAKERHFNILKKWI